MQSNLSGSIASVSLGIDFAADALHFALIGPANNFQCFGFLVVLCEPNAKVNCSGGVSLQTVSKGAADACLKTSTVVALVKSRPSTRNDWERWLHLSIILLCMGTVEACLALVAITVARLGDQLALLERRRTEQVWALSSMKTTGGHQPCFAKPFSH